MSKIEVDEVVNQTGDNDSGIDLSTNDNIKFNIAGSQKAVIDSSGNLLINTTDNNIVNDTSGSAMVYRSGIALDVSREATGSGQPCVNLNMTGTDGDHIICYKDGSSKGVIGTNAGYLQMYSTTSGTGGIQHNNNGSIPINNSGTATDNTRDLGQSNYRWDDVFATNGTIQTSDENEKQDIASATAKELNVAKKLSALFKTFRWKDKVTEKGDKARTHSGIIAQDIQSAFSAEGLDASNYGLFTSDTWTNEEGKEQTRLGVRYPELFSFIFSSIEARLTALEGKL